MAPSPTILPIHSNQKTWLTSKRTCPNTALTLVLLFRSFVQPVTILVALPLSVGGALGLLLITGKALGVTPLIGLLMLMGIAAKNSILLVEYALVAEKERGLSRV